MSSPKDTTGADLVGRIRAGSQEAEEELIQRYRRGVFIIINTRVRNRSDVEELIQDTFKTALEEIKRDKVREPEKLSGFVCGVATTLVKAHFRQAKRANPVDIDEAPPRVDPGRSPLEQVLQTELGEIVRQVIGELRMERDRQIITRFYLLEEDKESICASLGLTSEHFNRVIFRALARFKKLYEERLRRNKGVG